MFICIKWCSFSLPTNKRCLHHNISYGQLYSCLKPEDFWEGKKKKEDYVFIQKLNEINNFESNLQIAISHCNEGQKKKDTLAIESLPFL